MVGLDILVSVYCGVCVDSDEQHVTNDKGDGLPVLRTLSGSVSADRLVTRCSVYCKALLFPKTPLALRVAVDNTSHMQYRGDGVLTWHDTSMMMLNKFMQK